MGWGQARRPKISNILSSPDPREGSDGDLQLRQTSVGAKLFGKLGGSWYSTPLSIKEGEFTLRTRNGSDSIKLDAATGLKVGNWKINKTSIYAGTEDHSGFTASAGDLTIYSDGSDASIHAREFYITAAGRFVSTNGTIGSGTVFADDIVTTASIANNAITDALLGFSAQSWTTDMEIRGTAYNAIIWDKGSDANPTLTFADGVTQVMTKNTSTGLADNTTHFVYVTENTSGAATISVSSTYTNAVAQDKILLATVVVTTAAGGDSPSIFPYKTNSLTISAASIAANAITANAIASNTITISELATIANISLSGRILTTNTTQDNVVIGSNNATDVTDINGSSLFSSNVIIGDSAAKDVNVSSTYTFDTNVVIGIGAMMDCDPHAASAEANDNVAIVYNAMFNRDSGNSNVAIGRGAMLGGGTCNGADNIAIGNTALESITTGYENIGIGTEALEDITSGYYNIAIGDEAGQKATDTLYNIFIGKNAGGAEAVNLTGGGLYIGYNAWCSGTVVAEGVITAGSISGSGLTGLGTLTMLIGSRLNASVGSTYNVADTSTWNQISDVRFKTNIVDCPSNALSLINQLRVRNFNWKEENDLPKVNGEPYFALEPDKLRMGFIAQELEEILPQCVGEDGHGYKSLCMDEVSFLVIKAVQELSAKLDTMQTEINNLKAE